ncbi:hypothetical protein CAP35_06725 [Chitinophagaceae bacterium IBVUCB1]|nr:hypothetical protein CAP35_06725 [Chitinophagaceae bacterium IBVUCB1]
MRRLRLFILFCALPRVLYAQVRTNIELGMAANYTYARNTNSKYLPIIRPNTGLYIDIPIKKALAIRTGLGYSIRGYNTVKKEDFGKDKLYYTTNFRMHYLSVPLMASFRVMQRKRNSVWFDGGLQYNFFLKGYMRYDYKNYSNNELISAEGSRFPVNGKISPSKYGNTQNSYDVTGLDVAMKLQLRFVVKQRYSIGLFHESSLYDVRVKPDNAGSSVRLQNTGVSLGYQIR